MRRYSSPESSNVRYTRALRRLSSTAATLGALALLLVFAACGGDDNQNGTAPSTADPPDAVMRDSAAQLEAPDPTWLPVASEWQAFVLNAPARVRYGAGSTWIERDLPAGQALCTNTFFGSDPLPGVVKSCQTLQAAAADWTPLANEWQAFTLAAPTRVRYGAGSTWIERDLPAGQGVCSNAFFGTDPLPGVVKRCEAQGAPSTGTWSFVANEWGSFTLSAPARVRYGAGSAWVERDLPAGQAFCTNAFFGTDPAPGVVKRCEARQGSGGGGGGGGDLPADRAQAARFLTQATFGPTSADIDRLMSIGYSAWIDEQFAKPASSHRNAFRALDQAWIAAGKGTTVWQTGTINAFWKTAVSGDDQLRQRVAYALSQIIVVSLADSTVGDNGEAASAWFDMLADKGLGRYRDLLEAAALHPLMGTYLSHLKNRKADPSTGRVPDENFAREVMQLFSIGLHQLNADGTPKRAGGAPIETYTDVDITGLAKIFTGWSWQCSNLADNNCFNNGKPSGDTSGAKPDWFSPMVSYARYYSEDSKTFLGRTIAAASPANAYAELDTALDTIANHPNVAPTIGKQLIQRFVSSNPSPAYVADVAGVFANTSGDLKAVVKAILMHPEARVMNDTSGKVREPVLRMSAYMRAFGHRSLSGYYWINATDNPGTQLGQTPLRSPSVFNFYRPGYAAPGSVSASMGKVAPELQLVHETSVAGYVNYMRDMIDWGVGWDSINNRSDMVLDWAPWRALAEQPATLIDRVAEKLLYTPMPADMKQDILTAVTSLAIPTPNSDPAWIDMVKERRAKTAMLLIVASPEYQVQR
jgi:uncharacterized protein (DUF1800 family)